MTDLLANLYDPTTLVLGIALGLAGASVYFVTLAAAGLLLGGFVGLGMGTSIGRWFEFEPLGALLLTVLVTAISAWLGYVVAKKLNTFAMAFLGAAIGSFAAFTFLNYSPQFATPWSGEYTLTLAGSALVFGCVCAFLQRQFVMVIAAILGSLLVVTSFDPVLPNTWFAGLVFTSLALQTLTIRLLRPRKKDSD